MNFNTERFPAADQDIIDLAEYAMRVNGIATTDHNLNRWVAGYLNERAYKLEGLDEIDQHTKAVGIIYDWITGYDMTDYLFGLSIAAKNQALTMANGEGRKVDSVSITQPDYIGLAPDEYQVRYTLEGVLGFFVCHLPLKLDPLSAVAVKTEF